MSAEVNNTNVASTLVTTLTSLSDGLIAVENSMPKIRDEGATDLKVLHQDLRLLHTAVGALTASVSDLVKILASNTSVAATIGDASFAESKTPACTTREPTATTAPSASNASEAATVEDKVAFTLPESKTTAPATKSTATAAPSASNTSEAATSGDKAAAPLAESKTPTSTTREPTATAARSTKKECGKLIANYTRSYRSSKKTAKEKEELLAKAAERVEALPVKDKRFLIKIENEHTLFNPGQNNKLGEIDWLSRTDEHIPGAVQTLFSEDKWLAMGVTVHKEYYDMQEDDGCWLNESDPKFLRIFDLRTGGELGKSALHHLWFGWESCEFDGSIVHPGCHSSDVLGKGDLVEKECNMDVEEDEDGNEYSCADPMGHFEKHHTLSFIVVFDKKLYRLAHKFYKKKALRKAGIGKKKDEKPGKKPDPNASAAKRQRTA